MATDFCLGCRQRDTEEQHDDDCREVRAVIAAKNAEIARLEKRIQFRNEQDFQRQAEFESALSAEIKELNNRLATANEISALSAKDAEIEQLKSAIDETLRRADMLSLAAERGAGFGERWGERVQQAVGPLRDVDAFAGETLRHNRDLLTSNSRFLNERDAARARIAVLEEALGDLIPLAHSLMQEAGEYDLDAELSAARAALAPSVAQPPLEERLTRDEWRRDQADLFESGHWLAQPDDEEAGFLCSIVALALRHGVNEARVELRKRDAARAVRPPSDAVASTKAEGREPGGGE